MQLDTFLEQLNKRKEFRELISEEYKTPKFIKLYLKMYEYMLSIPKEKIVYKCYIKLFLVSFIGLITCFLEAKDFYNWKNRIYILITEKIHNTSYRKFELLYRSKAKEFFDRYMNKNLDHGKKTLKEKYGEDITNVFQVEEIKDKCVAKHIENLGVKNPSQSKEIQDKKKKNYFEKHGVSSWQETDEWKDKVKAKMLVKYGVEWYIELARKNIKFSGYSKEANDLFDIIDNIVKIEDTYYARKNKEYRIGKYKVDYCIPSLGLAFEFDGIYFHGLKEGQKFVKGVPVEEIWEADKKKQEYIEAQGFTLYRIREDDYLKDPEACINFIIKEINNARIRAERII